MTKIMIANYDYKSLVDSWLEAEREGVQFPVPFDIAWKIAGYSRKDNAKRKLKAKKSYFIEDEDFSSGVRKSNGGRDFREIHLTNDCFKKFCLMAETEQGDYIRNYFIEAEKKWQLVQQQHPQIAEDIERQRLLDQERILDEQIELMKLQNSSKQLDNTMLNLHGSAVVLALRGKEDQIVEKEKVIIEVVDNISGQTHRIMSADDLKAYVRETTGQKLRSKKQMVDILKKLGRDDLLIPVRRQSLTEDINADSIDEAIALVFSNRQLLIGE